jgi:glutamate synthase (NADPH/NADH) small chain
VRAATGARRPCCDPDFKLEKHLIDRRIAQMEAEGVSFRPSTYVGSPDAPAAQGLTVRTPASLREEYDAVIMAGGSETPRDLPIPGRELDGVMFAMDFLRQQNKAVAGDRQLDQVLASNKHVIVIGGGDTGSDCVGTSIRQGAASVTQIELLPQPPEHENKALTWPYWPAKLRTSTSHQEGCERDWAILSQSFEGDENGHVRKLIAVRTEWTPDPITGQQRMREIPDSRMELPADLVLLAMGFVAPVASVLDAFGVDSDNRGNARANTEDYHTNVEGVFAAGDIRRGQSLIVWAIREGRQCARSVDAWLMGSSQLPR